MAWPKNGLPVRLVCQRVEPKKVALRGAVEVPTTDQATFARELAVNYHVANTPIQLAIMHVISNVRAWGDKTTVAIMDACWARFVRVTDSIQQSALQALNLRRFKKEQLLAYVNRCITYYEASRVTGVIICDGNQIEDLGRMLTPMERDQWNQQADQVMLTYGAGWPRNLDDLLPWARTLDPNVMDDCLLGMEIPVHTDTEDPSTHKRDFARQRQLPNRTDSRRRQLTQQAKIVAENTDPNRPPRQKRKADAMAMAQTAPLQISTRPDKRLKTTHPVKKEHPNKKPAHRQHLTGANAVAIPSAKTSMSIIKTDPPGRQSNQTKRKPFTGIPCAYCKEHNNFLKNFKDQLPKHSFEECKLRQQRRQDDGKPSAAAARHTPRAFHMTTWSRTSSPLVPTPPPQRIATIPTVVTGYVWVAKHPLNRPFIGKTTCTLDSACNCKGVARLTWVMQHGFTIRKLPPVEARSSVGIDSVLTDGIELFVSANPTSPLHEITIYVSTHLPDRVDLLLANEVAAQINLSIDEAQRIKPTDYIPLKPKARQIVYETEFHLFDTSLQVGDLQLATSDTTFVRRPWSKRLRTRLPRSRKKSP